MKQFENFSPLIELQSVIDALQRRGCKPLRRGTGYQALCPAHDDHEPSLSIDVKNGKVLLCCHAGCAYEEVMKALDLWTRGSQERTAAPPQLVATYDYKDERNALLYQILRYDPKRFQYRRPDGKGGWIYKRGNTRWVPYRLPELLSRESGVVFLCEGERDADNLAKLGVLTTTNPGGAEKWSSDFNRFFGDREVVFLAHKDPPGQRHAAQVAQSLQGTARSIKVIELPGLTGAKTNKDVSDWIARGGTKEQLVALAERADVYQPPEPEMPAINVTNLRLEFRPTDLWNAARFVRQRPGDMRYCYPHRTWYVWTGRQWTQDVEGYVALWGKESVLNLLVEAGQIGDDRAEVRRKMVLWAMQSENAQRVNALLHLAQSEPGVPILPEVFDRDSWLGNCANGTINLETGELGPHRHDDFLTKMFNAEYHPEIPIEDQCPRWLRFLGEIMNGDAEMVSFLQRVIGYAVTGDIREQKMFMLFGRGGAGKSTFLKTLLHVFGEYGWQADPQLLLEMKNEEPHPTRIADLKGTRFVVTVEVSEGQRLAETFTKQMTGGDKIWARRMYQDGINFDPTFKLFVAVNHKPIIHGTDYAMWRRIMLIPFTQQWADEDDPDRPDDSKAAEKNLDATLFSEANGILTWAVQGCAEWRRIGLKVPRIVRDAVREYRTEMDVLAEFLVECCEVGGVGLEVSAHDLRAAYEKWCKENGDRSVSAKRFHSALRERGFLSDRTRELRLWKGIALKFQVREALYSDEPWRLGTAESVNE